MKKSFFTPNLTDDNPKWQTVTISDEGDETADECKYFIEISYAKNTSIPDKQRAIRNLIHIINISQPALNFKVTPSPHESVKVIGNLAEIIFYLGANQYIRASILSQIQLNTEINRVLQESNSYILPPDTEFANANLKEPTLEDLEDFGIINAQFTTQSTPSTPTKKIGFFESRSHSPSESKTPNENSVTSTPEIADRTISEETNKIPPTSPTSIKVK